MCQPLRWLRRWHGCRNEPPACDCDGRTHANVCRLWRAGRVLAHPGSCEEGCGGPDRRGCGPDEICLAPNCGDAGEWGVCSPRACSAIPNTPVCGCDGTTYASACDALTAGVGITWPNAPWARKGVEIARAGARADVTAARAAYDAEVNRVRLAVREAYIRAESAAARAALLRTSIVPQSTQALDVSRVGYQSDRGEFLDIIDNQRVLAEARLGYYRALAELEQARADLERAVGGAVAVAASRAAQE